MTIGELINQYEQQAEHFNAKIEALKPLLSVYKDDDLKILRYRLKTYYNLCCECKRVATLLSSYPKDEEVVE